MTRITFQAICVCALLCAGVPSFGGQTIDGFAAEVDGTVITVGDVVQKVGRELAGLGRRFQGETLLREQTRVFEDGLDQLIEEQLMIASFRKLGAQLPPGAVRERADMLMRQQFDNNRVTFQNALVAAGTTEQEWKENIEEQMIRQSMVQQFVRSAIHVAPREIRAAYEAKKTELIESIELELFAIAFRPVAEEEAEERQQKIQEALDLLEAGEDFSEVAKRYSEGPKAEQGGEYGWMKVDRLPDPLPEVLSALQSGDRTGLVDTPSQSYIFKVTGRRGGEITPLADAQPGIERELREQKYEQVYETWIAGLKEEFQVLRYNPDISAVTGDL